MLEYIKTRRASRQTVHNCYTELSLLCYAGLSIHPVSWEEVLSSLWKSCEIEVVEITDNISTGLVKSISVFQRNNVSVSHCTQPYSWGSLTEYFPRIHRVVRIPEYFTLGHWKDPYTPQFTQVSYIMLICFSGWSLKLKVRWNSILSIQFSEEKKSEVNSRQQVLPCAVEENHQELVYKLRNEIIVLQHISYLSSYKTK